MGEHKVVACHALLGLCIDVWILLGAIASDDDDGLSHGAGLCVGVRVEPGSITTSQDPSG